MRTTNGTIHKNRRNKILKKAKGFMGGSHRLYRTANTAVMKAGQHSYNSRRQFKREIRSLWIVRINAAARLYNISYSKLINKLKVAKNNLDRRTLANIAMNDPETFKQILSSIKAI